jgi:predicted metalloenzyme YecM
MTWEAIQATTDAFSEKLKLSLRELGIQDECSKLEIDHICVRIAKETDVDSLKNELENVGQIISAVNVNGREIMIIQLTDALHLGAWRTNGVELPYPKPNHKYEDGWEHVEFVLEGAENTMGGVRKAFFECFPDLNVEHLKSDYAYSEDEPHADGDQIPNPTIGLKVNNVGIKFHANPIQKVVGFES